MLAGAMYIRPCCRHSIAVRVTLDTASLLQDDADLAVPPLLSAALSAAPSDVRGGVSLVLLAERAGLAAGLAALAERRSAEGRRTVCLAAPLAEAADRLVEVLAAPTAAVLASAQAVSAAAGSSPGDCVPREPAALAALGR